MAATTAASSLTRTFSSSEVGRGACGARDMESALPCRVPFRCWTVNSKLARISSHLRIIPVGESKEADPGERPVVSTQNKRSVEKVIFIVLKEEDYRKQFSFCGRVASFPG